jgi:hypothetical protein
LFRVGSLASLFELQHQLVAEHIREFMQGSTALLRAVRLTADQTLPALEQHLGQRRRAPGTDQPDKGKAYQTAAE